MKKKLEAKVFHNLFLSFRNNSLIHKSIRQKNEKRVYNRRTVCGLLSL